MDSSGCDCTEGEDCPHFQHLKRYGVNDASYLHCTSYKHPTTFCRHGKDCRAFCRLAAGGFRKDDLCHLICYKHPRGEVFYQEVITATNAFKAPKPSTGAGDITYAGQMFEAGTQSRVGYSSMDEPQLQQGLETTQMIEDEVAKNGFGHVLTLPSGSDTLADIATAKLTHPRNLCLDNPLNQAEILAVLIYTGTDVQGHYRQDMLSNDGKWLWLTVGLMSAIKKAPRYSLPQGEFVYHGLHNVTIKDFDKWIIDLTDYEEDGWVCQIPMRLPVSTSTSRDVAVRFAAGCGGTADQTSACGMLLRMTPRCVNACDVSWISKFHSEQEVLVAPFQDFHVASSSDWGGGVETKEELLEKIGGSVIYSTNQVDGREVVLEEIEINLTAPNLG